MYSNSSFRLAIATLSLVVMLLSSAEAALVRFAFTASQPASVTPIDSANAPAGSYFAQAIGLQSISGIIEYDTSDFTPLFLNANPSEQTYSGRVDILFDQFSTANPDLPVNFSSITNDASPGTDQWFAQASSITSGNVGFYDTVGFTLLDLSGTAFSSTAVPTDLSLDDFGIASVFVQTRFFNGTDDFLRSGVSFDLTSLTNISPGTPVPLPATLPLFLAGIGVIGFLQRKKKRIP